MDYGKTAYYRTEELSRMINGGKKDEVLYGAVIGTFEGSESFSGNYKREGIRFCCKKGVPLEINISLTLSSAAAAACGLKLILNGAFLDTRQLNITQGTRQYAYNFTCINSEKGENSLFFQITNPDNAALTLAQSEVKISGADISEVTGEARLAVSREGGFEFVAHNSGDYVYYDFIAGQDLYTSEKNIKRGDFSFCSCLYKSGTLKSDIIYFYTDEGKLFMDVRPYDSDFERYRMLIDENAAGICCVETLSPCGCMLFYIKGGTVYCRPVQKDLCLNKILPCEPQKAAFSPGAKFLTGVQGVSKGYAFILSSSSGTNTMYMHDGGAKEESGGTVNASAVIFTEVIP